MTEAILKKISNDLDILKTKINTIEEEIITIKDIEPEVRQSYLKKLNKISKEKSVVFNKKNNFLNFLKNEL